MLHAVHADTGEERWRFVPPAGARVRSASCVASGNVHVATTNDSLYALSVDDGTEAWHYDAAGVVQTLPALAGGALYLITGPAPHRLHIVDPETGIARSVFGVGGAVEIVSSPTVAQGIVYFGDREGRLYAVDGQSGQEQWHAGVGGLFTSPVVANGTIYIGIDTGALGAVGGTLKPVLPPL